MPAEKYDQIALATEQLNVAIELFLACRSEVSSLTLAGAAEEILGRAVKLHGGENAMQEAYKISSLTHRYLHRKELKWQDFVDGENYARNAAKHLLLDGSQPVELDLRRAAMWMIVRASANRDRLDLERTDYMDDFNSWFYEVEVGV
jgi:hypothetical protein